ncbi:MAG TPA: DEAD/DEAH box helicase [Gammaproteobacteria bacterium]|nr:DEAD/DEAH box helicase [Gammaproteobacteria bacterium]
MLPGLLANEVTSTLREFIITGYETETWPFAGKFRQLVEEQNDGEAFIKGPYVSISLPFAKANNRLDLFPGFKTQNAPYVHQERAWQRLRSDGDAVSTLIATGTGSGKTECFLYPLLHHCQQTPARGVKAIVIYPMNALAGDQAKRFAKVISEAPDLRGRVRVGLFVGGGDRSAQKSMGPDSVITCKETLRDDPPDILLTNYKMLDFLLMRPKDQPLWQHNTPDLLRYLIVDELHTFDGAQGSDLAMLIRRLRARLNTDKHQLICAGTSATLGNEEQGSEDQKGELAQYAHDVFDADFDVNSIIGEQRQSLEEFAPPSTIYVLDNAFQAGQLDFNTYPSIEAYLSAQYRLFFNKDPEFDMTTLEGRVALGDQLRLHALTKNVLQAASSKPVSLHDLLPLIQNLVPAHLKHQLPSVLLSMLSLLAHARGNNYEGEPFVTLRLQLWARELRRIVSRLGDDTERFPVNLQFADDLKKDQQQLFLPLVQCSECHTTAWLTRVNEGKSQVDTDLRAIYNGFFAKDRQIKVLLPVREGEAAPSSKGQRKYVCASCGNLQLSHTQCTCCLEETMIDVFEPNLNKEVRRGGVPTVESQRKCPVCEANNSLLVFGARAASLSAVAVHTMYAARCNDDKKLIAFSDSVQDAAHRAGFFAGRTWHNNIRMAMAKCLHHHNMEMPLTKFYEMLPEFWLENSDNPDSMEPLRYIAEFIAPNMMWVSDYQALDKSGRLDKPGNLIRDINRRLVWEVLAEFGIRSQIGRSLSRTEVAALGWSSSLVDHAADSACGNAREQLGLSLDTASVRHMLWGIALRMRRQGAILHSYLEGYVAKGGDWYLLSEKHMPFMPRHGAYSSLPRFPASKAEKKLECLTPNGEAGWYRSWVKGLLGLTQLVDNKQVDDLLTTLMDSLESSGLVLSRITDKQNRVWALNPERLFVTTELASLECVPESGNDHQEKEAFGRWPVPAQWASHFEGMPSLDIGLKVRYRQNLSPRRSLYRRFYLEGEIKRVIAHEHTGLLERDYRENLERRFIHGNHPWDINLLSATPTLEMGIDIGDLSSVLLCSVPPAQANYLQRAGRGGRKDGNSFVLTLANGVPHDLYFYADPINMLAGKIESPAIFLNASMVLRRQLLAYCFDQWAVKSQGAHTIPASMQPVIDAVENHDLKRFPYTLIDFSEKHRDELWEGFSLLLSDKVDETTREKLKRYVTGGGATDDDSLGYFLLTNLKRMVDDRRILTRQTGVLQKEVKKLEAMPGDDSISDQLKKMLSELSGLRRLKAELNKKATFNYFTDEGLLPNYAFPEEGATLQSVIYRRSNKDEAAEGAKAEYTTILFEYMRPAQAALSELAPESKFYANNRKVEIERVEMAQGKNLEQWRLCPSCSHSQEILGLDNETQCPRCGDPMWANVSQKKAMLRLRQVYANTSERDAVLADDSDDREPVFFAKQMLIDFAPEDVTLAYALKTETRPFGFEFIRKATFREINFGRHGGEDQGTHVAGKELTRPGFRVCRECGMVQKLRSQPKHMFNCKLGKANDESAIIDCLYLYRDFQSEAIRILLPRLATGGTEEQVHSFVAALQLGLKLKFGGKVDHLNITSYDEPIPGSNDRCYFIVLFDSVPGGTGYLHELLLSAENIRELLRLSKDRMADCSCQNYPDLDGCYRCLYAYRNSYGMENTSRHVALEMLADILDDAIALEAVDSLSKIKRNPWVDSELEARFADALKSLNKTPALNGIRVRVSKDIVNGKSGYALDVGEYSYKLEPQVDVSVGMVNQYPSRPDFVIRSDRDSLAFKPVAVFLDGYTYHKDIVHEDLLKRQALVQSGEYLVWSLTWHDINQVFAGSQAKIPNVLMESIDSAPWSFINKVVESQGLGQHHPIAQLSPLHMLVEYLRKPDVEQWSQIATLRALCWLDTAVMQDKTLHNELMESARVWPSQFHDRLPNPALFVGSRVFSSEGKRLRVWVAGGEDAIRSLDASELVLMVELERTDTSTDEAQLDWQKLLQLVNIGQFLPNFFAATKKELVLGGYVNLQWHGMAFEMPETPVEDEWQSVVSDVDQELTGWAEKLKSSGIQKPEVGYELESAEGEVIGEAELAWPELSVAVLLIYQAEECESAFVSRGWAVFKPGDEQTIESLVDKIGSMQ